MDVKSATGQFVARGYYNPRTDIAIRILTHTQDETIDEAFLQRRVSAAARLAEKKVLPTPPLPLVTATTLPLPKDGPTPRGAFDDGVVALMGFSFMAGFHRPCPGRTTGFSPRR